MGLKKSVALLLFFPLILGGGNMPVLPFANAVVEPVLVYEEQGFVDGVWKRRSIFGIELTQGVDAATYATFYAPRAGNATVKLLVNFNAPMGSIAGNIYYNFSYTGYGVDCSGISGSELGQTVAVSDSYKGQTIALLEWPITVEEGQIVSLVWVRVGSSGSDTCPDSPYMVGYEVTIQ
ncbi:MAG TPA: hypothetical protein PKZ84_10095 [Anaerolineae bacterium]|nr:hypothetical protein [Anaerolineae bacterium]HQI85015.1 hypothetical protein [Anaerolineae bacterium]